MNFELEAWIGGAFAWTIWATVRLWAILRLQVLWRGLAGAQWNLVSGALALSLALLLMPLARLPEAWPGAATLIVGVGFEFLLGTVVGLWVALPGHAAIGAGAVSGEGLGLQSSEAWRYLWTALTLVLGLAMGAHRAALQALGTTLARWPIFTPDAIWDSSRPGFVAYADLAADLGLAMHAATLLALALATPVLLVRAVMAPAMWAMLRGPGGVVGLDVLRPWIVAAAALVALGAAWMSFPEAWAMALG